MAVGDAHVFPGFLTPVLTQLFLPKPPITFLTCFSRGESREVKIHQEENSHQQGIELTTTWSWVRHIHHGATWAGPVREREKDSFKIQNSRTLYQILCLGHPLKSSRRDNSNEYPLHRAWKLLN